MHIVIKLDRETVAMYALSSDEISRANDLLSWFGTMPPDQLAQRTLLLPEKSTNAAMFRALHAPYPWPWQAAELDEHLAIAAETFDGCKLFCGLFVHASPAGTFEGLLPTPSDLMEKIETLGAQACPFMFPAHKLASLSHHATRSLAVSLMCAKHPQLLSDSANGALGAWALPILYKPKRFGPYEKLDNTSRGLLSQSLADLASDHFNGIIDGAAMGFLGLGPFRSMMCDSPILCAPINLNAQIQKLCASLRIDASELAVSVSFHLGQHANFMRIGIRPNDTGFCLSGIDWPTRQPYDDTEFDRLLSYLTSVDIEWCYQVEGEYDDLLCSQCGEPVYPNPVHEQWTRAAIEAGAPSDGSHSH